MVPTPVCDDCDDEFQINTEACNDRTWTSTVYQGAEVAPVVDLLNLQSEIDLHTEHLLSALRLPPMTPETKAVWERVYRTDYRGEARKSLTVEEMPCPSRLTYEGDLHVADIVVGGMGCPPGRLTELVGREKLGMAMSQYIRDTLNRAGSHIEQIDTPSIDVVTEPAKGPPVEPKIDWDAYNGFKKSSK